MRRFRRKNEGPKQTWETIRVYDELSDTIWPASLPLDVLREQLPLTCRYTYELNSSRMMAMGMFGGMIFLFLFVCAAAAGWPLVFALLVPAIISPIGVLYGWLKGYEFFMYPSVWVVRRMYDRTPNNENDYSQGFSINYEALPAIVPEVHTKLTGMPLEMAAQERRSAAEAVLSEAQSRQGRNGSGGRRGGTVSVATKGDLAVAYTPRIWRASTLYEMLKARDIRARMKGPNSTTDKLQRASMAGMALGSVGLLIAVLVFVE